MIQDDRLRLECAIEAIGATGNKYRTVRWYHKWMPEHFAKWGIGTTAQYSMTVMLMDDAFELLTGERVPYDMKREDLTESEKKALKGR